eukprot:2050639-Pyramimonas_sp.AAC.1
MWLSPERRVHSLPMFARASLVLMANATDMVIRHDSGVPERSSYVNSQCRRPRNGVLARFRMVKTQ